MNDLPSTNRNELIGSTFTFVGFTFLKHPARKGYFLQVSVYKEVNDEKDLIVICTSEGKGRGGVNQAISGLGQNVRGEFIAPFAQRAIDGPPGKALEVMSEFKETFEQSYPTKWYWHDPSPPKNE